MVLADPFTDGNTPLPKGIVGGQKDGSEDKATTEAI
jgi:hypothetical protein